MSDNNFVDPNTDDLDAFNDLFHGHAKELESGSAEPASEANEETGTDEEDTDASLEHTPSEDTDEDSDKEADEEQEDDSPDEEKSDPEPPKKPKNRTQQRIDQLLERERIQKERADALEARLSKLEQPKPEPEVSKGPTPDDKNEDGTDKYPLGEFDPLFVRDLMKHEFAEQKKVADAEQAQRAEQTKQLEAQAALEQNWNAKLEPALERYPDFQEKGENLVATFEGLDQNYSNYLTSTLQAMEFGPDVLYYLANNVDEAQRIVNLGATGATIALGRLEAKFAFANEEKQKARPKVSKAPAPPPTNKGSAVSTPSIAPDTDDLDAFSAEFFKGKKR